MPWAPAHHLHTYQRASAFTMWFCLCNRCCFCAYINTRLVLWKATLLLWRGYLAVTAAAAVRSYYMPRTAGSRSLRWLALDAADRRLTACGDGRCGRRWRVGADAGGTHNGSASSASHTFCNLYHLRICKRCYEPPALHSAVGLFLYAADLPVLSDLLFVSRRSCLRYPFIAYLCLYRLYYNFLQRGVRRGSDAWTAWDAAATTACARLRFLARLPGEPVYRYLVPFLFSLLLSHLVLPMPASCCAWRGAFAFCGL